jgi:hypothetical protein
MKTRILPSIAYVGAVGAFLLFPFSAAAATVALSVTGLLSIFAADYSRSAEPVVAPAPAVPASLQCLATPGCRAAA